MPRETSWLESMPEIYDRCLGQPIFAPHAAHVAQLAAAEQPRDVLELAAGTGLVTAELVRALPAANIVATDLNPAMVSWAAHRVPGPTWRTADAMALEFADASFDLVLCQFGVMFFPDRPRAFAEACRVLRPGATLLFTAWDALQTSELTVAFTAALHRVVPDEAPDFLARIPHGYHDPERMRRDVAAGGLAVDRVDRVVLRGRASSAQDIATGFCLGTPLRFGLEERGDPEELAARVGSEMTAQLGAGPVDGQLAAFVVTAHRPAL
jgi:SAM-dependent methyltransferase